jgi:hypothetical protein
VKGPILVLMLVTLALTGCGKRARYLDPPEGTHEIYPKHYPPPDDPGTHL